MNRKITNKKNRIHTFTIDHLNGGAYHDIVLKHKHPYDLKITDIMMAYRKNIKSDYSVVINVDGKSKILIYND